MLLKNTGNFLNNLNRRTVYGKIQGCVFYVPDAGGG